MSVLRRKTLVAGVVVAVLAAAGVASATSVGRGGAVSAATAFSGDTMLRNGQILRGGQGTHRIKGGQPVRHGQGVSAIRPPAREAADSGFSLNNLLSPGSRGLAASVPLLSLEVSHSPATVQVGQELTLTDKVIAGPHSLDNVVLIDTLPNEFTFLSGDAPGGACTADTSGYFPIVTCPLGAIAGGDSVTVNLLVRPNVMGGYTNNAYAKGFDGSLGGTVFSDQWSDLLTVDPPTPSLSIDDVSHNEGDSGTTAFDFTVSLSNSYTSDVTVDYASADATATAPGDYQAATGTLTFAPGQRLLISIIASMNARAKSLCSSMPVATASTFGSKIRSSGGQPSSVSKR